MQEVTDLNATTTDNSATATPERSPAKWTTGATLGPRMAKAFNDAYSDAYGMAQSFVTRRGIRGVSESVDMSCLCRTIPASCINALWKPGIVAIQDKHGSEVTPDNYRAMIEDLNALKAQMRAAPCVRDETITPEEHAKREAIHAKAREDEDKRQLAVAELRRKIEEIRPRWAGALIVAFLEEDDCDHHSDYFNTKKTRAMVIGFRSGSREDFRQLRAAAARHPETKHLDCDEAEHRDNYSMGRGNYLKIGGRYSTGWFVESVGLSGYSMDSIANYPYEIRVEAQAQAPASGGTEVSGAGGVVVKQNDEHDGVELYFPGKPDEATLTRVKGAGFRWSRFSKCWYAKRRPHTLAFAYGLAGQPVPGATQSSTQNEAPAAAPETPREPELVRDPGEDAADRWAELHMRDACNA